MRQARSRSPLRFPHHHIRKGLTHPSWLVVAATCLLLLFLLFVLIGLVVIVMDDFWVILLAWMQA